jgi:hypothetical protein
MESHRIASATKETEIEAMAAQRELGRVLRRAGPYVLIEIVLPGGTLVALLLMLYRRGPTKVSADARRLGAVALRWSVGAAARGAEWLQARGAGWLGPTLPRERDGLEPLGIAFG